jgi:hypothetical protein
MPKYVKLFETVTKEEFYSFMTMDEFVPEGEYEQGYEGHAVMNILLYHMVPSDELSRKIGGNVVDQLRLVDIGLLAPENLQMPHVAGKLLTCIYTTYDAIPQTYFMKLKRLFPGLIEKYKRYEPESESMELGVDIDYLEKFQDVSHGTGAYLRVGEAGGKLIGMWSDNGSNTSMFAVTSDVKNL